MKRVMVVASAAVVLVPLVGGCSTSPSASPTTPSASPTTPSVTALPVWQGDAEEGHQRILVISDIHLGIDDAIAETVENKALLIDFLERSTASDIDEIVIAGDFLDEWYLPTTYPTHSDSKDFYLEVKENNAEVFAAFQKVMESGITLTYIPGNHDVLLDEETMEELLPGIEQARDAAGLGMLRTGARSEVVIEHGHRYDAGAAPDPLSSTVGTGGSGSILPFGYFVTRMIVTSLAEGKAAQTKQLDAIPPPTDPTPDQLDAYAYYNAWMLFINSYPIEAALDDDIFMADFAGFAEPVSLRDLLPTLQEDGSISAKLYPDLQQRWEAQQAANGVLNTNPFATSLTMSFNHELLDAQASRQYFQEDPNTDVVVFGHSHTPLLATYTDGDERPKTYANSGTWIDRSHLGPSGTFVAIESGPQTTDVRVLQYRADGTVRPVPNPS